MNPLQPETPVTWIRYPSVFTVSAGYGFGQGGFGQGGFGGSSQQSGVPQPIWSLYTIS